MPLRDVPDDALESAYLLGGPAAMLVLLLEEPATGDERADAVTLVAERVARDAVAPAFGERWGEGAVRALGAQVRNPLDQLTRDVLDMTVPVLPLVEQATGVALDALAANMGVTRSMSWPAYG